MMRPLVIYDFATAPFCISFYMGKVLFSFLSVYSHLQEIEETREFVDEGNTMIMTMRVPGKDESVARRVFKRIANY
jgi:hypothetical protein